MKRTAPVITALLALLGNTALAHHSDPQQGLLGSVVHWLTEPDHLLLIAAGILLAFLGHKVLTRD